MRLSLNHLSFGGKFVLVLLAPTLGLLVFATLGIVNKIDQHTVARRTEKAMRLIVGVDDAIAALQRERGLSMAFARDSDSRFHDQLSSRRGQTDSALANLTELFAEVEFRRVAPFSAPGLIALRERVEEQEEHHLVFAGYTEIIENGLRLTHVILGPMNTYGIDAYMPLHWSQEAAGRQRAMLMGIVVDQRITQDDYLQLSAHTRLFRQKLDEFEHAANTEELAGLQMFKDHPASTGVNRFLELVENKRQLATHTSHIRVRAGFLGLVHDYKNFLVRDDPRIYASFVQRYAQLEAHIADLLPYANTEAKRAQIDTLKITFAQYRSNLDVIASMRADGHGVIEIDQAIAIDGTAITKALDSLEFDFSDAHADEWWQLSSKQIDLLAEANANTIASLQQKTKAGAQQAEALVLLYISLAVGALLAAIILAVAVLRQVAP